MLQKIIKNLSIYSLMLIAILFLGFYLRQDKLYTWPRLGATFDEYAWTWEGMNLIQKGVPISWSPHPEYKNYKNIIYQQTHFRIVTPFLEHPPVFGLVAGGFAILNGASDMYHLSINNIRPLAVILGVLSIFLVYLLTKEIYEEKVAVMASLLYATIPTVVVGSRIVQNENFFIPVWLLTLFLIVKYIKTKNDLLRNIAFVLCILLVLAKIPWVAASGSVFLIFLYLKQYKNALLFFTAPIIGLLIFVAYGYYYDSHLFISLWGLQLNRYDLTFNSIFALFQKPYLVDRFLTDGWIYFGWFAAILVFARDVRKNYVIIFALLSYFVIFLAGIPDEPSHGWYRYPFYPFLVISIALFIKEYYIKNWVLSFVFLVVVGTSLLELTWRQKFGFSYLIFRLSIISWGSSLFPLLTPYKNVNKFGKLVCYTWFVIFIFLNVWAVHLYNEQ